MRFRRLQAARNEEADLEVGSGARCSMCETSEIDTDYQGLVTVIVQILFESPGGMSQYTVRQPLPQMEPCFSRSRAQQSGIQTRGAASANGGAHPQMFMTL